MDHDAELRHYVLLARQYEEFIRAIVRDELAKSTAPCSLPSCERLLATLAEREPTRN